MFKIAKPIFMRAITPVHAGSGQDLGIVDMPIQREKHTGIPKIEGSGVKGVFREFYYRRLRENNDNPPELTREKLDILFGPEEGNQHAASLGFTDARLLFFPVRSLKGIFALITCPYILERFQEDLSMCGGEYEDCIKSMEQLIHECKGLNEDECYVLKKDTMAKNKKIFIEEYMFSASQIGEENTLFDKLAQNIDEKLKDEIKNRIVILTDEIFIDFVTMYTEIITRNRIDITTGTTDDKALFTEEYLPAESILYSLVLASDRIVKENNEHNAKENIKTFTKHMPELIQIGGNITIGKGLVKVKVLELEDEKDDRNEKPNK